MPKVMLLKTTISRHLFFLVGIEQMTNELSNGRLDSRFSTINGQNVEGYKPSQFVKIGEFRSIYAKADAYHRDSCPTYNGNASP
jgi:hypothetical protein